MKTFKSPWLWCCAALPLLLAGCNTGFSKQEVNSMRALTPKQRDQLGQELATELRRTSLGDQGKYYLRDIRYRNSDDTLVYDMEMKSLDNFRQLVADGINVIPRVPLIPGYTLNETNMTRVLDFLLPSGIRQLHLLPFHQYGEPKYRLLGQEWGMRQVIPPTEDEVSAMRQRAEREGFNVTLGG